MTGWWFKKHEMLVNTTLEHKNEIKVVFLGDSITANWLNEGKELWDKYYANRSSYNYGISGDNTQNVLWRIQNNELDGLSPKFVVLKIGNVKRVWSFDRQSYDRQSQDRQIIMRRIFRI